METLLAVVCFIVVCGVAIALVGGTVQIVLNLIVDVLIGIERFIVWLFLNGYWFPKSIKRDRKANIERLNNESKLIDVYVANINKIRTEKELDAYESRWKEGNTFNSQFPIPTMERRK